MIYIDIHTHQSPPNPEDIAVIAVDIRKPCMSGSERYAVGIHPWQADQTALPLIRTLAAHPNVVAVGEVGLDKSTSATWSIQEKVFAAQIRLAGEVQKPLIIHCVKAWQELMAIRKAVRLDIPWIIHGFRGNGMLAGQLLRAGFFLSFGLRHQAEAVRQAREAGRLLAETDDEEIGIRDVYASIATTLAIPEESLSQEVFVNAGKTGIL
ncbi:MAG: TatD family hydrolase [Tannerella sp.]|jgi:TatD DNase family protein|nr:TatD family hydrolase [Tannerella sp.]